MENPLVSVIIPTFNAEKYISDTIISVQNQSYQNWEMLLVDDGSTDATQTIITSFLSDKRIQFYPLQQNFGPAKARNVGIDKAKGKYLTFLDADDIWFADFIEKSIKTAKDTNIPFVFSSYKRSNERLEFVYSDFIVPERVSYTDILKTNSISCLTAFIDVDFLGKKHMPEIYKRQDMGLWLKYLKEIPFAYGIKETQAIYRIRENSLSRNKFKLLKYQWQFYYKVENLDFFQSIYYMMFWIYNGLLKYR